MAELHKADRDAAEAFVDGSMTPEDAAAFGARVESEPALAAFVDELRAVDARLVEALGPIANAAFEFPEGMFGEPSNEETGAPQREGLAIEPPAKNGTDAPFAINRRLGRLLVAAAVLLVVGAGVRFGMNRHSAWLERRDTAALYRGAVANFRPDVVCDTPEKFREYTERVFGRVITADFDAAEAAGVELIGWRSIDGYARGPDGQPAMDDGPRLLLARGPDGTEIVVLFERTSAWPAELGAHQGEALWSTSKVIGGRRVTEVSPFASPMVLGLLGDD